MSDMLKVRISGEVRCTFTRTLNMGRSAYEELSECPEMAVDYIDWSAVSQDVGDVELDELTILPATQPSEEG